MILTTFPHSFGSYYVHLFVTSNDVGVTVFIVLFNNVLCPVLITICLVFNCLCYVDICWGLFWVIYVDIYPISKLLYLYFVINILCSFISFVSMIRKRNCICFSASYFFSKFFLQQSVEQLQGKLFPAKLLFYFFFVSLFFLP